MTNLEITTLYLFDMKEIPFYGYAFFEKYISKKKNKKNLFYNKKKLSFFEGEYRINPYKGLSFIGFRKKDFDEESLAQYHFKLHYAVDHRDLEKAIEVMGAICSKYNIPEFKVVTAPIGLTYTDTSYEILPHGQEGKDFTIYINQNQYNAEFISNFTQELETSLKENNIRPSNKLGQNILTGDKRINGSDYGFYRYETLSYRNMFRAPSEGDFMENVSAQPNKNKFNESFISMLKNEEVYDFIIKKYYQAPRDIFYEKYQIYPFLFTFTALYQNDFNKNPKKYQPQSQFKLHYAIDHRDLEKAIEIIGEICSKNNIPGFKFVNKPFQETPLPYMPPKKDPNSPNEQDGKDFTIYIGKDQDNPQFMTYFTQLIEHNLLKNGIRPAPQIGCNILMGDKPIKGSIYGFYRYPFREDGSENSRYRFNPPLSGDFMNDVIVTPQSAETMMHVLTLTTEDEANKTTKLLNQIGIKFSLQKNDKEALEANPNLPPYKLFHQNPKHIKKLLDLINKDSFENTFSEEIENSDQPNRIQLMLKKIGIPSHQIQPVSNDKKSKRIIFCAHNDVIQQLMKNAHIDHISQMDVASVYSREEANRLWKELNKLNIPAAKTAYKKEDGTIKYSLVYKKDAKTDQLLIKLNTNFIDEKNPSCSLRDYAHKQDQRMG